MYFTPHDNNEHSNVQKKNISDTLVLLITILLLTISAAFPLMRATAEAGNADITNDQLIISIADKGYGVLLSSLFGKVGKKVPEGAHDYIRDIDEYRVRIAQGIKENNEMTQILYTLIENFPKKLADGYREEIDEKKMRAERLKIDVFPYIESDAALSYAVVEKYGLFTSFTEWLVYYINKKSIVGELNKVQKKSYTLRKEIALLYIKINSITQKER